MGVSIVNTLAGVVFLILGALIFLITGPTKLAKPAILATLTGYVLIAYGVIRFFTGI